ncbi:MAG: chitinase [Spirochaetales bacterium]|nr:chitinase [Spirochaetales bacterium]
MKKYLSFIILVLFIQCITFGQNPGDVNNDSSIDIIDALMVAQFYVGLDPDGFVESIADVSGDVTIDIVDALLIARYFVGLIDEFPVSGQTPSPTPGLPVTDYRIIGYFPQWGIYSNNYHVKNIAESGSAGKLTVINYAFGNIVDCECIMKTQSGVMDAYADYQKIYSAEDSVDGVADTWDQPLRGSFNQLKKLKQKYPHLKVFISLGGWTWSKGFHEAALTDTNRKKTAASCIDVYIKGNLPVADNAGGQGAGAGIFDGIDIDWEYPNNPGDGNPYGPEDKRNFTLFLAEFRKQLDEIDHNLLLTIASPGGEDNLDDMELDLIHQYLDWINLMNYDYHGAWDANGPTNHISALFGSPDDPSTGIIRNYYTDYTIQKHLETGIPADKLNIGVPFYGRGWSGVINQNNGLYQQAARPAQGTNEPGMDEYRNIKTNGFPVYWDPVAQASWCFNGDIFWSYDTPGSLENKMKYVKDTGLGGVMFWELNGDTSEGELITTLYNSLQ